MKWLRRGLRFRNRRLAAWLPDARGAYLAPHVVGERGKRTFLPGAVHLTLEEFLLHGLSRLPEDSALLLHYARLKATAAVEPEEAIGASKDFVEAASRHVLHELREPDASTSRPELPRRAMPALAAECLEALGLSSESEESPVRRMYRGLHSMAVTTAELRNVFGTGHGRVRRALSLSMRETLVATTLSQLYVAVVLDLLEDVLVERALESEEPASRHTVAGGETLSKIAVLYYDDPRKWPRIFAANRDLIDNPHLIYPGQILRIPR